MKLKDIKVNNPYLNLPSEFYDTVEPTPLLKPHLIHANKDVAKLLDIDEDELYSNDFLKLINGEYKLNNAKNFASCYAGHQFGHFVPRLGDGRAINIGTINDLHLQLKGAGQTLYSRMGDGRAVLRSSIREYLMSEAMHNLGVETTRALAIIGSKHRVRREIWESGAIVCRVSPSWIRFGTFEYFAHKGLFDELEVLANYAIKESYPHLELEDDKYFLLFVEVLGKSAKLVAKWQSIGFSHGVLNTDNMSIAGLSIDYGPYAFMDDYEHNYICNHTDRHGRYKFSSQPAVFKWNLQALASALSPLVKHERLIKALEHFDRFYHKWYMHFMSQKLGLDSINIQEDSMLINELLKTLQNSKIDYTQFFRTLSHYDGNKDILLKLGTNKKEIENWLNSYDKRVEKNSTNTEDRLKQMQKINPKYVLKNYMLQEAINLAQKGDFTMVDNLFKIAKEPYSEHPEFERFAGATPPEFKNQKLSCSS